VRLMTASEGPGQSRGLGLQQQRSVRFRLQSFSTAYEPGRDNMKQSQIVQPLAEKCEITKNQQVQ